MANTLEKFDQTIKKDDISDVESHEDVPSCMSDLDIINYNNTTKELRWKISVPRELVKYSAYICEYPVNSGEPIPYLYFSDAVDYSTAVEAVSFLGKIPEIADALCRFHNPDPAVGDTLESMSNLHKRIQADIARLLKHSTTNPVLNWMKIDVSDINRQTRDDSMYVYYTKNPFPKDSQIAFLHACEYGQEQVAKWFHGLGVDIHSESDYAFRSACCNGHETIARWLHSLGGVTIHEGTFHWTCSNGHEAIARWLYSLGGVDIHGWDDFAFRCACYNGHETIARWLHSLGANIHALGDSAFKGACGSGHETIARWLYGLGGVNIHLDNDNAFMLACENGHETIAKWLYKLGGVNIHAINDNAFRMTRRNGHETISEWLYGLGVDDTSSCTLVT